MKRLGTCLILAAALCAGSLAAAADTERGREAGYFENTRTVMQLDAAAPGSGEFAARAMNRELSRIFRYPYYQKLDTSAYSGRILSMGEMEAAAVAAGADIITQPVVVRFDQYRRYPLFFGDDDPVVTTIAEIRLSYWEEGMKQPVTLSTRFFDSELEGPDTDPDDILDRMWKRLMKQFPYRRVPTDRSTNLSGTVTEKGSLPDEEAESHLDKAEPAKDAPQKDAV